MLPAAARRRLGLKPGTKFACRIQGGQIILQPAEIWRARPRLVRSRLTGLIVTKGPKGAQRVTNEQVRAILADFP